MNCEITRYRATATNFLDLDIRDGYQTLQNFEIIVAIYITVWPDGANLYG